MSLFGKCAELPEYWWLISNVLIFEYKILKMELKFM